jgi:hypothetical protein
MQTGQSAHPCSPVSSEKGEGLDARIILKMNWYMDIARGNRFTVSVSSMSDHARKALLVRAGPSIWAGTVTTIRSA